MDGRDPQRAAQGEAMNRLDEIDADVELRGTMARIKPAELRQLVAVARAAARLRDMDTGNHYDDIYAINAALAPLLASTEPMVVATARDNAGNAATVVAPLLAEKEG
jgi:hypothetical protein